SDDAESVELTVVGSEPVILDRASSLLRIGMKGTEYDLNAASIDASIARLQQPGPASDKGVVALATGSALVEVPLDGGASSSYPAGGAGDPVAPVQLAGCSYGAWNQANTSVRACEGEQNPTGTKIPEVDGDADLTFRVNQ